MLLIIFVIVKNDVNDTITNFLKLCIIQWSNNCRCEDHLIDVFNPYIIFIIIFILFVEKPKYTMMRELICGELLGIENNETIYKSIGKDLNQSWMNLLHFVNSSCYFLKCNFFPL